MIYGVLSGPVRTSQGNVIARNENSYQLCITTLKKALIIKPNKSYIHAGSGFLRNNKHIVKWLHIQVFQNSQNI